MPPFQNSPDHTSKATSSHFIVVCIRSSCKRVSWGSLSAVRPNCFAFPAHSGLHWRINSQYEATTLSGPVPSSSGHTSLVRGGVSMGKEANNNSSNSIPAWSLHPLLLCPTSLCVCMHMCDPPALSGTTSLSQGPCSGTKRTRLQTTLWIHRSTPGQSCSFLALVSSARHGFTCQRTSWEREKSHQ